MKDKGHRHLSAQFTIIDRITDELCEFQRAGINASLTACTCRQTAKIMEGHLKSLVRNSKFTNGFLKIH
jgi:hypothetical protein